MIRADMAKAGAYFFKKNLSSPSGCPSKVDSVSGEMNTIIPSFISALLKRLRPKNESSKGLATQSEFQFDSPGTEDRRLLQRSSKIHLNLAEKDPTRLLARIEEAFAAAPEECTIELIGPGILLHDNALMLFEELRNRPSHTRLHIRARTCLIDGAILLWLAGDTRSMRADGWIQLSSVRSQQADLSDTDGDVSILIEEEPANTDLRSIHRHINEWLPVQEITGRRLFEPELREFGLLDDAESQIQLAALFHAEVAGINTAPSPETDQVVALKPQSSGR
jgi:hypothetical protein